MSVQEGCPAVSINIHPDCILTYSNISKFAKIWTFWDPDWVTPPITLKFICIITYRMLKIGKMWCYCYVAHYTVLLYKLMLKEKKEYQIKMEKLLLDCTVQYPYRYNSLFKVHGKMSMSGAEYLASIYGTEKDKVNCSFYIKTGACRHSERCSRKHNKPQYRWVNC